MLMRQFGLSEGPDEMAQLAMRYNIAPPQSILAVRQRADGREAVLLHWGLIPS